VIASYKARPQPHIEEAKMFLVFRGGTGHPRGMQKLDLKILAGLELL
jgi:hypothetical protein